MSTLGASLLRAVSPEERQVLSDAREHAPVERPSSLDDARSEASAPPMATSIPVEQEPLPEAPATLRAQIHGAMGKRQRVTLRQHHFPPLTGLPKAWACGGRQLVFGTASGQVMVALSEVVRVTVHDDGPIRRDAAHLSMRGSLVRVVCSGEVDLTGTIVVLSPVGVTVKTKVGRVTRAFAVIDRFDELCAAPTRRR